MPSSLCPPPAEAASPAARAAVLPPLSLRVNFAWNLVGHGVYGACQWGMLIALAKLGSPEIVGRFTLGLALCAPVVMFANLHLRAIEATDARHQFRFRDYLSLRLSTSALALAVIAAIAALGGYRLEVVLVILGIGLAKSVESVSDIIYGIWQKHERLNLIAISLMIRGPASLLALSLLVYLTRSVAWAAFGLFATSTLTLLTFDAVNALRFAPPGRPQGFLQAVRLLSLRGRLPVLRSLAWLALPLGVVSLLDSLNVNVPRYLIEKRLGEAALGYFAAMAYIMVAGNLVVGALAQSAAPRLARHYVEDRAAFARLLWKLVQFSAALALGGVLLAVLFGRPFLSLLYKPEYAAHADVFAWLMLAAGLGYISRFLVSSMTAARRIRAQAPLYALSLLVLAALCFYLVPNYGLAGAAWAICAGVAIVLIGAAAVNLRALRSPAPQEDDPRFAQAAQMEDASG